ncbi:TniQ family protein [Pseudomonas sp. URMO17WK12:I11]|uniref:TniQ family protein n=1 Tax=Pseudomonas sp. URMO17WK12:I11 TaxID=1283291 RepID=UPI003FA6DB67
MLLQILPDESLGSYVRRTLFLNRYDANFGAFKFLAGRPGFTNSEINLIAESLGWPGCYGFNRLLHHHTPMAAHFVIKHPQEAAYSGKAYGERVSHFEVWDASFCPDCVREDLFNLGFSYWRRSLNPSITACHRHNTVLVDRCPFCGKSFNCRGHTMDVMWSGCGGRNLGEAISVPNQDHHEFKRAKAFYGVCSSPNYIPYEGTIRALYAKTEFLLSFSDGDRATELQTLSQRLGARLRHLSEQAETNEPYLFEQLRYLLIDIIAIVYESVTDFLVDASVHEQRPRAISTLWATYQAGGQESANYVEEDYIYGVGHWSCPYPSASSERDRSGDGYARRRPKIYPCCNIPHSKGKGQRLSSITVKALPGIPVRPARAKALGLATPQTPAE